MEIKEANVSKEDLHACRRSEKGKKN